MAPLLERNAVILEELERDWSKLSPLRTIEFRARFANWESDDTPLCESVELCAKRFMEFAESQGCECKCSISSSDGCLHVTASKKMKPTAINVTFLQERLQVFLNELPYGEFCDWGYPPRKEITFWPRDSPVNYQASEDRSAVLFGEALVADPVKIWSINSKLINSGNLDFALVPSEFLRFARTRQPVDAQPTASAFSQWVYSLYGHAYGDVADCERGKHAERDIWTRRSSVATCNDNKFLRSNNSPWRLIHNGLHLDTKEPPHYIELSQLSVNNQLLRAFPDLVYFNQDKSEIIIVEIKYSQLSIPRNLWPNVWAQLWCYSHIPTALSARKVTVIGEVWGDRWIKSRRRKGAPVTEERLICLRASVRRDPRVLAFDQFFRELFRIYSGS